MYQGKSLGMVTISVGVAAFPEHGRSPKELMAAADAALYQAKRGGRDQVVVALAPGARRGGDSRRKPSCRQLELVAPKCRSGEPVPNYRNAARSLSLRSSRSTTPSLMLTTR